jgi:hypothetical protein
MYSSVQEQSFTIKRRLFSNFALCNWSKVLLEKLFSFKWSKNSLTCYRTQSLGRLPCFPLGSVATSSVLTSHLTCSLSILILSSHLRLALPSLFMWFSGQIRFRTMNWLDGEYIGMISCFCLQRRLIAHCC